MKNSPRHDFLNLVLTLFAALTCGFLLLLRGKRLDPRDIAADRAHSSGVRELPGCSLKAQVELLFLEIEELLLKLILGHHLEIG
jgi:hypothetical protein